MALENADIDKIAILARLQVTPSETSDYANSISSILSICPYIVAAHFAVILVIFKHGSAFPAFCSFVLILLLIFR